MKRMRLDNTPTFFEVIIFQTLIIGLLLMAALFWKVPLHSALLICLAFGAIYALYLGFDWKDVQEMLFDNVKQSIFLLLLMPLIGAVVGAWIVGGIVPTMIYYGIKVLTPRYFLILAPLITAFTAITMGTSWGTASTIGIAIISIGKSLGLPLPLLAGSVISALFFGETLSPLSGSANLTAHIMGLSLREHFKGIRKLTVVVFFLCVVLSVFLGYSSLTADSPDSTGTLYALENVFTISPLLFIPPILIVLLSWRGLPVLPALGIGVILGIAGAYIIQGQSMLKIFSALHSGVRLPSDNLVIGGLSSRGGIESMMPISTLLLLSLSLSGILEKTSSLRITMKHLLHITGDNRSLIVPLTILIGALMAMVAGSQTLAIILLAKMFLPAYKQLGVDTRIGSFAIVGSAVVMPPLIPWNVNGLFLSKIVGLDTLDYVPYTFFCYLLPLSILIGYFWRWLISRRCQYGKA